MEEKVNFEQALAELEDIVVRLEGGESLTLDESLKAFEEGIRLARVCRQTLDQAELRVRQLTGVNDDDGDDDDNTDGDEGVPF